MSIKISLSTWKRTPLDLARNVFRHVIDTTRLYYEFYLSAVTEFFVDELHQNMHSCLTENRILMSSLAVSCWTCSVFGLLVHDHKSLLTPCRILMDTDELSLKFCFKTCVAMKFVDDDDDDHESMSSMLHEIFMLFLTVICRCPHRFQPCVVLAITCSGSCIGLFDACLSMPPKY